MYTQDDLDDAVEHRIFTREAVACFRMHHAQRLRAMAQAAPASSPMGEQGLALAFSPANGERHAATASSPVDEEHFRLIGGFNDIFVVIACALTLVSTYWIAGTVSLFLAFGTTAVAAWLLAECFVRSRRMALPAIVLLLTFTANVAALGAILFAMFDDTFTMFAALLAAALAAWVHWLRFRVALAVAVTTGALLTAAGLFVLTLLFGLDTVSEMSSDTSGSIVFFACGVLAFLLAMRWDMRDPHRVTDRSDIAFWLHMLAAPLLVHPVFSSMTLSAADGVGIGQAMQVVALYLVIGVVSLAIDRRALMVAALSYVLVVFANLLTRYGMVNMNFAITAFVVGAALLLLSVFWHGMRARVVRCLPASLACRMPALRQALPRPRSAR